MRKLVEMLRMFFAQRQGRKIQKNRKTPYDGFLQPFLPERAPPELVDRCVVVELQAVKDGHALSLWEVFPETSFNDRKYCVAFCLHTGCTFEVRAYFYGKDIYRAGPITCPLRKVASAL